MGMTAIRYDLKLIPIFDKVEINVGTEGEKWLTQLLEKAFGESMLLPR